VKKGIILFLFFGTLSGRSIDFFWDSEKASANEVIQKIPSSTSAINWTEGKVRCEIRIPYTDNASPNIGKTLAQIGSEIRTQLRSQLIKAMGYVRVSDIFLLRDYYSLQNQIRNELLETVEHAFYYPLVQEKGFMKGVAELDFYGENGIAPVFFRDMSKVSLTNFIQNSRDLLWYDTIIVDTFLYPEFLPSLHFRIYDTEGNLIYGPEVVSESVLQKKGVCRYVASLSAAFQREERGSKIFYVVPVGMRGKTPTEIIISKNDARKLLANAKTHETLRAGRVLVVKPN
jgi:hypothetical protein